MASQNIKKAGRRPESTDLVMLEVVERRQLSPHFVRVRLGGGTVDHFAPLGYDQWFRLFIPVSDDSLARVPSKLTLLSYAKYLTVSKTDRPVIRNYTVRGFSADGPHGPTIDVDFVVHGSAEDGTAGPAATWAAGCQVGDPVAILDEGSGFDPAAGTDHVVLVGDESAVPALAAILESLPSESRGRAVLEVPSDEDRLELTAPDGVEVTWVVRGNTAARPGEAALAAVEAMELPGERFRGWAAGEQSLASGVRRHWVGAGVPKEDITFCGYWRAR